MKYVILEEDKNILKKYNINVDNFESLDELLFEIDDEMTSHIDGQDEPLKEFIELQKVYDRIYYANKC